MDVNDIPAGSGFRSHSEINCLINSDEQAGFFRRERTFLLRLLVVVAVRSTRDLIHTRYITAW